MLGRIRPGQLVTVAPMAGRFADVGDIALCRVRGRQLLHMVKAVRFGQYLIGNNRGGVNGWIADQAIYGVCILVED